MADDYGRLKHDHPLWRIRHGAQGSNSGPGWWLYTADRDGVHLEARSAAGLDAMIRREERQRRWGR